MITVHKYHVPLGVTETIALPADAVIRHVGSQDRLAVVFWAEVDTAREREMRRFRVFATGEPLPERADWAAYVGSVQDGPMVWHLYEVSS